MKCLNERLRELRKKCGLSQEELGKKLGVTKAAVSKMELGTYQIADTMLKLMCSEFNVNEKWFRSGEGGEGDMFVRPQKSGLITRTIQLLGEKDPVFGAFVATYSKLSPSNRKVLLEFGLEFLNNLDIPNDN